MMSVMMTSEHDVNILDGDGNGEPGEGGVITVDVPNGDRNRQQITEVGGTEESLPDVSGAVGPASARFEFQTYIFFF